MTTELSAAPSPVPAPGDAPSTHQFFSVRRVGAIASNTLLELVRLKVFYFMLLFALLTIGSTFFFANFTFQEQLPMLKDVSLGGMSVFSWLLAVLATAMLLPKDVEDRTLYTILAKPVPRFEYLLGKLLGIMALLLIAILLMTALFVFVLWNREQVLLLQTQRATPPELLGPALDEIRNSGFTWNILPGIVSIYVKAVLCASLTLFLSTFSTSWIFTVLVSIMCYFVGYMQGIAREVWMTDQAPSAVTKIFLAVVSLMFPDLQLFSLVDDVAAGTAVPALLFWKTMALGGVYTSAYLIAGYFMFAAREL
jgi:hypothetical protein